jgi:hypothetical protein
MPLFRFAGCGGGGGGGAGGGPHRSSRAEVQTKVQAKVQTKVQAPKSKSKFKSNPSWASKSKSKSKSNPRWTSKSKSKPRSDKKLDFEVQVQPKVRHKIGLELQVQVQFPGWTSKSKPKQIGLRTLPCPPPHRDVVRARPGAAGSLAPPRGHIHAIANYQQSPWVRIWLSVSPELFMSCTSGFLRPFALLTTCITGRFSRSDFVKHSSYARDAIGRLRHWLTYNRCPATHVTPIRICHVTHWLTHRA